MKIVFATCLTTVIISTVRIIETSIVHDPVPTAWFATYYGVGLICGVIISTIMERD